MKKIILAFSLVIYGSISYAQSTVKDDLAIVQSVFGKDKKMLVANYMQLRGTDSVKFWNVYDVYETERKKLAAARIQTIARYADNYMSLNDNNAKALADETLSSAIKIDNLHKKYFNKLSKSVGALKAAKFFQLESYLQNIVSVSIQEQIPFIDELK